MKGIVGNQVKSEIEMLRDEDGLVRVPRVYEWAKQNRESAIGSRLEWNDKVASDNWRMHQIRNIIIVHCIEEYDGARGRSYISIVEDRTNPGGGYRPLEDVVSNDRLREAALREIVSTIDRLNEKYSWLELASEIWEAGERLKENISNPIKSPPRRRGRSDDRASA